MSRVMTNYFPDEFGYDDRGFDGDVPKPGRDTIEVIGIYWPYWRKWADRLGCDRAAAYRLLGGYETDAEREIAVIKWETEQAKVNAAMIKANLLKRS